MTVTNDKSVYTRIAPTGVEALNTATCFRHSDRGNDVASNDVDSARTAGAIEPKSVIRSAQTWIAR